MVYRIYVEKKEGFRAEAAALLSDLRNLLGVKTLLSLRIINRYDLENLDKAVFDYAVSKIFSEPQTDTAATELDVEGADCVFGVEYLPGQFDQRADSAAQCIQLASAVERPTVRTAKIYVLEGALTPDDIALIKKYVINPVECREADLALAPTLATDYKVPDTVGTIHGFCTYSRSELANFVKDMRLAMDEDDAEVCRDYFRKEGCDPTITEIRMLDTYWSDHCRHTTFLTTLDKVSFESPILERAYNRYVAARSELHRTKPINLMDIATIGAKLLKKQGMLDKLDESEEINACTVKIKIEIDGQPEDYLLLFKNETHNHPTEIEPFGGAATCIGGAIRDPLSGRAYVYAAMRVTGAGNPLTPVSETVKGKLSQRKIVTTAAAGYSSYGNQIGLATGLVDEIYHEGYVAKRMEIGAVIGAVPACNVRRETPVPGDKIILLGGRTGRDGCGGATGSSKSHSVKSIDTCGAEVQKGNAPEERKLQRLFRNKEAALCIKRCNDFGAGGVSVAIGELADGVEINLNAVPKKYEGLDGTELAISESQERMAVVVEPKDAARFIELARGENLEAVEVAEVTASPRLVMRWNGVKIVDISRDFLNSNGAEKHISVKAEAPLAFEKEVGKDFGEEFEKTVCDLNVCSKRGLAQRFDSTIGAGTVLMPFGGKYQLTPEAVMVNKISVEKGDTDDVSFMAYGFNPYISEKSPYHGAYCAVVESISRLIAAGASFKDVYLTFQEYFEKPMKEPTRWGKPLSALLGALSAQLDLGAAAIGGKDSMSGTFENIDVPPTLVSFAVTTGKAQAVRSGEFKSHGHNVVMLSPAYADGLPDSASLKKIFCAVSSLLASGKALSARTIGYGGAAEAVFKMAIGNGIGFSFEKTVDMETIFGYRYGSFVLELDGDERFDRAKLFENVKTDCCSLTESGGAALTNAYCVLLGKTTAEEAIAHRAYNLDLERLKKLYEGVLEPVFPVKTAVSHSEIPTLSYTARNIAKPAATFAVPKVLIPVFPGTNCEYDTARAARKAGLNPEIFVINNLSAAAVAESAEAFAKKLAKAQAVFIPGGFSGGDEPDGSGKFITSFFRNGRVAEQTMNLLKKRDGLICGVCNGFQALIKLGLVPYGEITEPKADDPTLTFNVISRHQSGIVRTRVASVLSPWLSLAKVGEIYSVPISHGEGRFVADGEWLKKLAENGQIATQYVDLQGNPTYETEFNPNGSAFAVEGITSRDGRVFGKMGHSERVGRNLYRNVVGDYDIGLFESAAKYYK